MPHYGILREYKLEDVDDVRGADVYGVNDEKLGTIDDVIFDHANGEIRYIVLKSGGLLSSKKVMVPANRIGPYGNHDDKFYAELDKERLEMLPEFNDETLKSETDWNKFEENYEERWNSGAVMYNKDTGRIITPPASEQPVIGQAGSQGRQVDVRNLTPERLGKQDDYLGVASGAGKTTLQPKKPSIAGRESVAQQENMGRQASGSSNVQDRGPESLGRSHAEQNPGRENLRETDVNREGLPGQRNHEVEGVMGTEFQVSTSPESTPRENMREPGVYKLDPVPEAGTIPETEKRPAERDNSNYGRRWMQFQQHLRDRRDKVVSGCNLCGTQDKAA